METAEALLLPADVNNSYGAPNSIGGNHEYLSGKLSNLYPHGTRLLRSWRYRRGKRCIDLLVASTLLLLAIIPGFLIAIAIAASSKGPIFFREWRVGRAGQLFRIWKFRSMSSSIRSKSTIHLSSDNTLRWRVQKSHPDPRITPIGTFLRRWSLDEIPQILNVLRGEMSLVGPRPVVEAEIPLYAELKHFYLAASPGMSGLWQVTGRSNTTFSKRAELDAFYVANWSIRRDLLILFKTIPAVLGCVGAR